MSVQNFKIKHGLNLGEQEIIDISGNIKLPSGATISVGGLPFNSYTPPTDQGAGNFLSGDGTYKVVAVPTSVSQLTNDSNYQTLTQVQSAVAGLVNSAPATLDTLNELATALGNDANFSTTITNSLANKANLSGGTFTGNVAVNGYFEVKNPADYNRGRMRIGTAGEGFPYVSIGMNSTGDTDAGRIEAWNIKALSDIETNRLKINGNYGAQNQIVYCDTTYSIAYGTLKTVNGTSLIGAGNIAFPTTLSSFTNDSGYALTSDVNTLLTLKANTNTPTFTGTASFDNNVVINGNLTVNGDQIINNTSTMEVEDPLIYIGTGNIGNSNDIGFVGHFTQGTYQHTGLVRDASDNKWRLFSGVTSEPSGSTLDFTSAVYDALQIGALTSTSGDFSGNLTVTGAINRSPIITLDGALTGSVTLTNLQSGTLTAAIAADAVTLGTNTIGSYVASASTSGNGISGSVNAESGVFTVTSNATNLNTASTLVYRDASGNFSAGTITAALSGNATTASTLQTARSIALSGDVTGSVSFNGSADVTIVATVAANSVALGADTTGNYMVDLAAGTGVSVSHTQGEGSTATVSIGQSVATTATPTFAGLSSAGGITPSANASYDLGSATLAWRHVYTNDLHLSNEGHETGNFVDGTRGNWTIQEGAENLYIINNKTGKKYKFALEEIQ